MKSKGLIKIIVIELFFIFLMCSVNGLNKNDLCTRLNFTFSDCDDYWSLLTNYSIIVIHEQNNLTNTINNVTIINNTIIENYTIIKQPEKTLEQMQLEFEHDEKIACIKLPGCDLNALMGYNRQNESISSNIALEQALYSRQSINQATTSQDKSSFNNLSVFWIFVVALVVGIVLWRLIDALKRGKTSTPANQDIKQVLSEMIEEKGSKREIEDSNKKYRNLPKKKKRKQEREDYEEG